MSESGNYRFVRYPETDIWKPCTPADTLCVGFTEVLCSSCVCMDHCNNWPIFETSVLFIETFSTSSSTALCWIATFHWCCISSCIPSLFYILCEISFFSKRECELRSRSLYVTARPSVCLSSVTFVHPTRAIEIFGNVSTPFGTSATHWHPASQHVTTLICGDI